MDPIATTVLLLLSAGALAAAYGWQRRQRAQDAERSRRLAAEQAEQKAALEDARRQAAAAERAQHWFQTLIRQAPDILLVYTADEQGQPDRYLEANDAACRILGYERADLLKLSPLDTETFHQPPPDTSHAEGALLNLIRAEALGREDSFARRALQSAVRQALKEGEARYEGAFVTRQGTLVPADIVLRRVGGPDRPAIACFARDASAQRRWRAEAHDHRAMWQDVMNHAPIGIALYDGHGALKAVNAVCLRMFGCPDQHEFARFSLLRNDYLPATLTERLRGDTARAEATFDFDDIKRRGLYLTSRSGQGVFDLLFSNLGTDANFAPRGYLTFVQDVTERKHAERMLADIDAQLRQAQKLQAIGTLAGGIAHDFNNILTPILGYAELLLDMVAPDSEAMDCVRSIVSSSLRAKELVQQILTFSRRSEEQQTPIRLTPIVKEVVKQTAAIAPPNVEARCTVRTVEDLVLAGPTQIHQVLTNLCANALYAMKETGGLLEVTLSSFTLGALHRHEFPNLVTVDYLRAGTRSRFVRLSVRDTGCGMDADTLQRIFEPFFTTKPSGEGTGMGLPVVHGIVTSLGGAISAESQPGKGTTFHVVLPLAPEIPPSPSATAAPAVTNGARILFVDDDITVATLGERILLSAGYRPTVSTNSRQALDLFAREPAAFDLVITDQVMPEMSGIELSKALLEIRPNLPILLCTGFTSNLNLEDARASGIREIVAKPVERYELVMAIERALQCQPELNPLNPA